MWAERGKQKADQQKAGQGREAASGKGGAKRGWEVWQGRAWRRAFGIFSP